MSLPSRRNHHYQLYSRGASAPHHATGRYPASMCMGRQRAGTRRIHGGRAAGCPHKLRGLRATYRHVWAPRQRKEISESTSRHRNRRSATWPSGLYRRAGIRALAVYRREDDACCVGRARPDKDRSCLWSRTRPASTRGPGSRSCHPSIYTAISFPNPTLRLDLTGRWRHSAEIKAAPLKRRRPAHLSGATGPLPP